MGFFLFNLQVKSEKKSLTVRESQNLPYLQILNVDSQISQSLSELCIRVEEKFKYDTDPIPKK